MRQIASSRLLLLVRAFYLQGDEIVTFPKLTTVQDADHLKVFVAQWREGVTFPGGSHS